MEKLKSRLQVLLGLSLFFPVVMQALFDKETSGVNHLILQWSTVIAVLIVNYLIIEYFTPKFSKKVEKILDRVIGINILLFVPVIMILATNPVNIAGLARVGLTLSVWGIITLPIILLVSMILYFAVNVWVPYLEKKIGSI